MKTRLFPPLGILRIVRKLWRNRLFTGLNVFGLAIGISACWIIFRIANYELSFDRSHPDGENIYQVVNNEIYKGREYRSGSMQLAPYPYLAETFAHQAKAVPLYTAAYEEVIVEREEQMLVDFDDPEDIKNTTADYFDLVPYRWLAGDPKTAIARPNQVVLTHARAKQYFGDIPPGDMLGRTLQYDTTLFAVTGVVADLDRPSSFSGKEFMAVPDDERQSDDWTNSSSYNKLFVKVDPQHKQAVLDALNAKREEMTREHLEQNEDKQWFDLLPLAEKHFAQAYASGEYTAERKIVLGLAGIGAFLLLLACINYINLSTAQIPHRAKEIGIRKTLGEKGFSLTARFFGETLLICLLALLLALPMVRYFLWQFGDFMPPNIHEFDDSVPVALFLAGLVALLTLLSGLYPAYLINRVRIVQVLKAQSALKLSFGNIPLRKALIVFQFFIAQLFVIGTFIVASQTNFLMNTDLGFDKNAVVTIPLPTKAKHNAKTNPFLYKEALRQYPEIGDVALGHLPLSNQHWGATLTVASDTAGETTVNMPFKYTDADYFGVYGIRVLAGRAPQQADTLDGLFINEAARVALGFPSNEAAVGQTVTHHSGKVLHIHGIFNDFHTKFLHVAKEPTGLRIVRSRSWLQTFSVRLAGRPSEWPKALATMEREWKTFYPDAPFRYTFYDEELATLYQSDVRQARMINLATVVTIVLSCLGLIGLVTLTAYRRTKEIGIRKVLGASVTGIIVLLSKDYVKLIVIAFAIAAPIGWWAMNKWLEDFAYRIDIQWWMLLSAGLATVAIALLSVSYQAGKAARANPVDSLRDE